MESAKNGKTPAPYGQACAHCVKAKARCMLLDGGKCERCHRLKKECIPSSGVRKKSFKNPAASKRSQLEDKIDDLVSILRTQHSTPQQDSTSFQAVTPRSLDFVPQVDGTGSTQNQTLTEEELENFRCLHLPCFPLIHLPLSLSARQLEDEKPLLSLAIKTISNKAYTLQAELSKNLRKVIALKMMVDGEKSVDLLLTVLTCIIWSLHITYGKRALGMFAGLARSLVSDLRLDKPPNPSWCPVAGPYEQDRVVRSNESRRAYVACFALITIEETKAVVCVVVDLLSISTAFKYDMMPWSPQLEQDCSQLTMSAETEGDHILVAMARISRVSLHVADVSRHLNEHNITHATVHIAPLISSLDQLGSTFPEDVSQHSVKASIVAYMSAARISIYELITLHAPIQSTPDSQIFDHKRIEYLMALLYLCKQCTEQHLNFDFIKVTTPTSVFFAHSLRNIHKLSTLTDFGWDPSIARQTVNIVEILDLCAARVEEVNAKIEEELGEHSIFAIAAKAVRESAPPNWRAQSSEAHDDGDAAMQEFTESLDLPFMDFLDDCWSNPPFYL